MKTIINTTCPSAEENNKFWTKGYKFKVVGDWEIIEDRIDPWSGMPDVKGATHFFTDRAEAEAYAAAQTWPFNSQLHSKVEEVIREETWTERLERVEAEKAARAAVRATREANNAAAKGMTVEEYKAFKKVEATKRRYTKKLVEMEAEVERIKAEMEEMRKFLATH